MFAQEACRTGRWEGMKRDASKALLRVHSIRERQQKSVLMAAMAELNAAEAEMEQARVAHAEAILRVRERASDVTSVAQLAVASNALLATGARVGELATAADALRPATEEARARLAEAARTRVVTEQWAERRRRAHIAELQRKETRILDDQSAQRFIRDRQSPGSG